MAGIKINEATLRETLKGTENIPIVDTDLPKGRTTLANLKEYVKPESITVDAELSDASTNPVQNKVITERVNGMQEELDLLLDNGLGLWYGIEYDITVSSPDCTRIGNMDLHRSLPVQSRMKGCLLADDGTVTEYLNPADWRGNTRDGSRGQVMVELPMYYRKFETEGNKRRVKISEYPLPGYHQVRKKYVSAYEATVQRSTTTLCSVVNEAADYRGGNNNAEWDGTYRSLLGRPATAISRTNFRNYARKRKSATKEWNCMTYDIHKDLYWLFIIEYATLNSQKAFNASKDSNGSVAELPTLTVRSGVRSTGTILSFRAAIPMSWATAREKWSSQCRRNTTAQA